MRDISEVCSTDRARNLTRKRDQAKSGVSRGGEMQMLEPEQRVLHHPLRVRILAACSEGEVTVEQFAKDRKIERRTASNHFRALERAGLLNHREVQVRGVLLHLYRAAQEPIITDSEFAGMDKKERNKFSESVIRDFVARCWAALDAGTLDSRDDSHLTWLPLTLDEQGWKEAVDLLTRVFEALYEIRAESRIRLRESGEPPIPTIFGLAGFEVPPGLRLSPPASA
jgi:DNA-binding transcriptional ArsR family regulator